MSPPTSSRSRRLRRQLVERLRADEVLASPQVAAAFAEVLRERFIPELLEREGLEAVYRDEAVVTKRDARGMPLSSSSQPAIMAKMLELLDLRPGQRVLEIGAGTGYDAALLSHIVGSAGQVTSVDVDPELARAARRALRDGHRTRTRWRLDRYGRGAAVGELEALLEDWRELRRTGRDHLKLTAYGSGERLRLRFAWGV